MPSALPPYCFDIAFPCEHGGESVHCPARQHRAVLQQMIGRQSHHLGGSDIGLVHVRDGKVRAVERARRTAVGKVHHGHHLGEVAYVGAGNVLHTRLGALGRKPGQRGGRRQQSGVHWGRAHGHVALIGQNLGVRAQSLGRVGAGPVEFSGRVVQRLQCGGPHHGLHYHGLRHHVQRRAALADVGVDAHRVAFAEGLPQKPHGVQRQRGRVEGVYARVGRSGRVGGLAVKDDRFAGEAVAGHVAQKEVTFAGNHMYMRGQRKVHAVEAARAQQFGFAAAEFHALLLQRLPRADGDIFLGGNGKKRHAARKRLGHPGRAQRQRGAHQRGELRIVPAGMGNAVFGICGGVRGAKNGTVYEGAETYAS